MNPGNSGFRDRKKQRREAGRSFLKYSEEEINSIEKKILDGMSEEDNKLKEIELMSESITKRLIDKNHTRETIDGTEYIFSLNYDKTEKRITVMRADPVKLLIANGKYRPAIFTGEWDFSFTFEENVYMVVKTALCHAAGMIDKVITEQDDTGV